MGEGGDRRKREGGGRRRQRKEGDGGGKQRRKGGRGGDENEGRERYRQRDGQTDSHRDRQPLLTVVYIYSSVILRFDLV